MRVTLVWNGSMNHTESSTSAEEECEKLRAGGVTWNSLVSVWQATPTQPPPDLAEGEGEAGGERTVRRRARDDRDGDKDGEPDQS